MKKLIILITLSIFTLISCSSGGDGSPSTSTQVPTGEAPDVEVSFNITDLESPQKGLTFSPDCGENCTIATLVSKSGDISSLADREFLKGQNVELSDLNGEYYIYVQAKSSNGKLSKLFKRKVTFDNTPPEKPQLSDSDEGRGYGRVSLSISNLETNARAKFYKDSGCDESKLLSNSQDRLLESGAFEYSAKMIDEAGNTSECSDAYNYQVLRVKKVVARDNKTCALTFKNDLFCFGENAGGRLGQDSNLSNIGDDPQNRVKAIDFGTEDEIIDFAISRLAACAAFTGGKVKCWGTFDGGVLGTADLGYFTVGNASMPVKNHPFIVFSQEIKQIVSANDNMCVLLENNQVKCWGSGGQGLNGNGSSVNLGIETGTTLATNDSADTDRVLIPVSLPNKPIKKLVGNNESFAMGVIFEDGTAHTWGRGFRNNNLRGASNGNIGDNEAVDSLPLISFDSPMKSFASAFIVSFVILKNGSVIPVGQVDNNSFNSNFGDGSFGQKNMESLPRDGNANFFSTDSSVGVRDIAKSDFQACAISTNDDLKCWGDQQGRYLGYFDTPIANTSDLGRFQAINTQPIVPLGGDKVSQVSVGSRHICYIRKSDGALKCYGQNGNGQLLTYDTDDRGDDETVISVPYINFYPQAE